MRDINAVRVSEVSFKLHIGVGKKKKKKKNNQAKLRFPFFETLKGSRIMHVGFAKFWNHIIEQCYQALKLINSNGLKLHIFLKTVSKYSIFRFVIIYPIFLNTVIYNVSKILIEQKYSTNHKNKRKTFYNAYVIRIFFHI